MSLIMVNLGGTMHIILYDQEIYPVASESFINI
jgi:hypothetical protein